MRNCVCAQITTSRTVYIQHRFFAKRKTYDPRRTLIFCLYAFKVVSFVIYLSESQHIFIETSQADVVANGREMSSEISLIFNKASKRERERERASYVSNTYGEGKFFESFLTYLFFHFVRYTIVHIYCRAEYSWSKSASTTTSVFSDNVLFCKIFPSISMNDIVA